MGPIWEPREIGANLEKRADVETSPFTMESDPHCGEGGSPLFCLLCMRFQEAAIGLDGLAAK